MGKKILCALVMAMVMLGMGAPVVFAGGIMAGHPGDLLLGYQYDLRLADERDPDNWENFLVVQNTTNAWVAAHLRFRSYVKSIEVWDHIILLSPYDVFWLSLTRKTDGGVDIYSADTHTLLNSGLIKSGTEYSGSFSTQLLADCGYTENLEAEVELGELEVIGLWQIDSTSHDLSAVLNSKTLFPPDGNSNPDVNGDGAVNALDVLAAVWPNADTTARPASPAPLMDCGNVLLGSMELGDIVTGQYLLYNLAGMPFFRTDSGSIYWRGDDYDAYHRDQYPWGVILYPDDLLFGRNYYADATEPAYYYNPDWATTTGPTLRDGNFYSPEGAVDVKSEPLCEVAGGLAPFNAAWSMIPVEVYFANSSIWGFFMEGAFNANIMTDVVLSFPTKYLHYLHYKVGKDCDDLASGEQWPFWDGTQGVGTYNDAVIKYRKAIKSEWDQVANGPVLLETFDIWDTEQNKPQAISGPSPHPLFDVRIPHEVNVLNVVNDIFTPIFEGSDQEPFDSGQFELGGFTFNAQQRDYRHVISDDRDGEGASRIVPDENPAPRGAGAVLGATVRIHEMPGSPFFRSTMAPLQWKLEWWLAQPQPVGVTELR